MSLNDLIQNVRTNTADMPNAERYEAGCYLVEAIAGACWSGKETAWLWNPFRFYVGDLTRVGGRYCMVEATDRNNQRMRVRFAE